MFAKKNLDLKIFTDISHNLGGRQVSSYGKVLQEK